MEIRRKNDHYEKIKNKEAEESASRMERNLERMARKDRVQKSVGRDDKWRSRKPMRIKFVRRVEPTEEELDWQRYVGEL